MATKHPLDDSGKRRQRGFSLLETAIVVAILAIVGASAAPSFSAMVEARRLDAAATKLAADIQLARNEAIARNQTLRLSVRAGEDATCWIVHSVGSAAATSRRSPSSRCTARARRPERCG